MLRPVRHLLPLALLAAVLSAAAGCGGVALDPVAAAASKTADAGSFRFSFSFALGGGGAQQTAIQGSGAYDAAARRLQASLTVGNDTLGGILDVGTAAVYAKPPAGQAKLPPGKTWLKLDLGAAAKQAGVDLGPITSAQLDPGELLGVLKQAGTSTEVGKEQIGGVQTTHYRVEIDPEQALEASGATAAQKEQAQQALQLLGNASFPLDVWVDDAGLLRRVTLDFDAGPLFSLKAQLDLSDYGADVHVDLPPADQVASAPLR
jgi:hypothetical protein